MPDERLPRCRILKDARRIHELLLRGRRRRGRYLSVYTKPSERPRAAFLVPRRYGNAALRNLQKRRLRELYRRLGDVLPRDRDVVILMHAKPKGTRHGTPIPVARWTDLQSDFHGLFAAGTVHPKHDPHVSA